MHIHIRQCLRAVSARIDSIHKVNVYVCIICTVVSRKFKSTCSSANSNLRDVLTKHLLLNLRCFVPTSGHGTNVQKWKRSFFLNSCYMK